MSGHITEAGSPQASPLLCVAPYQPLSRVGCESTWSASTGSRRLMRSVRSGQLGSIALRAKVRILEGCLAEELDVEVASLGPRSLVTPGLPCVLASSLPRRSGPHRVSNHQLWVSHFFHITHHLNQAPFPSSPLSTRSSFRAGSIAKRFAQGLRVRSSVTARAAPKVCTAAAGSL